MMAKNIDFTNEELRDYEQHKGKMHPATLAKLLLEQREISREFMKKYEYYLKESIIFRGALEDLRRMFTYDNATGHVHDLIDKALHGTSGLRPEGK
jgi:hypothetical protein